MLAEERKHRVEEFKERFANPYVAAERGYIDAVIRPQAEVGKQVELRLHPCRYTRRLGVVNDLAVAHVEMCEQPLQERLMGRIVEAVDDDVHSSSIDPGLLVG